MPHTELTQGELDHQFPTLVPPADEMLDDLSNDVHDSVYQTGLKVAEEIRSETSLQGRLRRPLLAGLQEQQQKDLSRSTDRARTSRTLGGGVLTGATALAATATAPTTTTTAVGAAGWCLTATPQHLPTTTNGQTTVGTEVRVAAVDGVQGKREDSESKKMQSDTHATDVKQIQASHSLSVAARTCRPLRTLLR